CILRGIQFHFRPQRTELRRSSAAQPRVAPQPWVRSTMNANPERVAQSYPAITFTSLSRDPHGAVSFTDLRAHCLFDQQSKAVPAACPSARPPAQNSREDV